ncbi:MAG: peptide deformylase [Planctomycetes bacterium]|nr:peptide deformylase [Planctomycetota bacterium]
MRHADSPTYPTQLTLVHYPDPVLRKTSSPVTGFDDDLRQFTDRMFAAMDELRGVGLAAPQVGVSKRIFVTDHAKKQAEGMSDRRVWINPRIEQTDGTTTYEEGCLSFPAIYARVERHDRFDIVWQDVFGFEQRLRLDVGAGDFIGIVVQHELDHLDGRVFVDLLVPAQLSLIKRRLRELEKDYKQATGKAGAVLRR